MTGISEILVLVLLIACIFILPRMMKGEPETKTRVLKKKAPLSAKIRLGIILSLIYPLVLALYLKPWNTAYIPYVAYGILPVFLAWSLVWVLAGRKK